jgi:hypothetical protein
MSDKDSELEEDDLRRLSKHLPTVSQKPTEAIHEKRKSR